MEYFHAAETLLIDGKYTEAIESFGSAIKALPDFAKPYSHRAIAYSKTKKFTASLQDCNKAIALDSSDESVYFRKG